MVSLYLAAQGIPLALVVRHLRPMLAIPCGRPLEAFFLGGPDHQIAFALVVDGAWPIY